MRRRSTDGLEIELVSPGQVQQLFYIQSLAKNNFLNLFFLDDQLKRELKGSFLNFHPRVFVHFFLQSLLYIAISVLLLFNFKYFT